MVTIYTRTSGTWRTTIDPHVRVSGTWRDVQNAYVRLSGSWRSVYQRRAPTQVSTWNPTDSATWRTDYDYWRTDNDDVYQGSWAGYGNYYGLYFYNSSSIRSVLQADGGRVITNFRAYLVRKNSSHGYTSAQSVYAYLHNYDSQPGGIPTIYSGPYNVGSFTRGQAKWVDLPNSWAETLRDGTRRGIGFYSGSSPYVILDGQNTSSNRGRLEITHS